MAPPRRFHRAGSPAPWNARRPQPPVATRRRRPDPQCRRRAESEGPVCPSHRRLSTIALRRADRDQVDRAAAQLRKLGQTVDLNEVYGYLTQWKLIGPFDNTDGAGFNAVYPPEKELRADASYAGKHKAVGWIDYRTAGDDGRVDLNKPLGEEKSVTGYAWAVFTTDRPRDAMLRITSDNALKVFVNGALVGRFQSYHGGTQPDQYLVPVTLKSGRNEILVKVCQNDLVQEWTRSWDFTLRVTDAIGSPLLRPAVSLNAGRSEKVVAAVVLAAIGLLASPGMDSTQADDWQQFRGTLNQSVASPLSFPTQLRAEKHVAWKVSLPGRGPSSPIVVGNRVIVTAASGPRRDRLHVLAFDTATGKLLWERQLWATGHCVTNPFGGVAAPTPASDGQHIIAFFSSNDLACFDLEGNLLWLRGLAHERPDTRNDSGMASSPLIVQDTVVVQMETQAESWAAGLNVVAGETQWQLPREQIPTWTSPTLLPGKTPDQDAVLLQSRSCLTAHDPRSGKEIWRYTASCSTLSSPTVAEAVVFLPAGGIAALRVAGQPPEPKVLWQEVRLGIENVSPIVHEGRLYIIRSPSILVASDATNGKMLWQLRLKGPIWATPVVAGNRLYAVNHDGLVQVVRLGTTGSLVGSLALEGGILASPAVAGGAIYFRSHEALWKLAPQAGDKADD